MDLKYTGKSTGHSLKCIVILFLIAIKLQSFGQNTSIPFALGLGGGVDIISNRDKVLERAIEIINE